MSVETARHDFRSEIAVSDRNYMFVRSRPNNIQDLIDLCLGQCRRDLHILHSVCLGLRVKGAIFGTTPALAEKGLKHLRAFLLPNAGSHLRPVI